MVQDFGDNQSWRAHRGHERLYGVDRNADRSEDPAFHFFESAGRELSSESRAVQQLLWKGHDLLALQHGGPRYASFAALESHVGWCTAKDRRRGNDQNVVGKSIASVG